MQRALRDLRSVNLRSSAEIFRLGGLEARFNVLSETVGRRLGERAVGGGAHRPVEIAAETRRYDPEAGIVLGRAVEPEAVVHHAAMVGMGVDLDDLPDYVAHNDLGTAVLLTGMARAGVGRLVLASSMVVYGEGAYACAQHGPVDPQPRQPGALAMRSSPREAWPSASAVSSGEATGPPSTC